MNRSIGIVALRVIQAIALIALIRGEQVRACDDFSGPAITIEGIEVRTNGQTVAVYTDNAFYDPAVNNEIKLDFRGWSACAVDEAWGAQPLNAVIDGGAIDIISFASEITGCSGGLHAPKLGDNFGPIWTPGPHTVRIEGTTRDASCSWVSVNSRPVTIWVADSNGQYGIEPKDCESEIGNPVNIVSGKMYHQMTDLVIQGSLPIHFTRRFDSKSSHDGPMGYGWQHNYMVRIDSTSATTTTLIDEQMRRVNFNCAVGTEPPQPQCLGVWHPNAYDHLELIQGTDPPWRVKNKHGKTWDFDSNGNLTKITDRNGNWNQIAYPNSGLITVTDNLNRTLSIALVGGRVDHITAGDRTVSYVHDTATGAAGNLLTVTATNPNSEITVASYGYDSASHRLRTATDANGNLMESHDYTSGRVTHTESDDGNYAYTIGSYSSSTQRTVTNERDTPVMTTFTIDPRTGFTIDREGGPGCSSCGDAGDETHLDYDDHFDLRSVTDGEGVVVEMDYDSNGNLLTRTEAPGTTYERTTSYEYDDEFNLPTAIRVPTVGTPSGHHDGCGYWRAHKVIALERNLDNGNIELASMLGCDVTDSSARREQKQRATATTITATRSMTVRTRSSTTSRTGWPRLTTGPQRPTHMTERVDARSRK